VGSSNLGGGFRAAVIHGHIQLHSHAKLAIGQFIHAHDPRHILAIHRIVGQLKGKVTNTRMPL